MRNVSLQNPPVRSAARPLAESLRLAVTRLARRLAAMPPADRAVLARAAQILEEMLEGDAR